MAKTRTIYRCNACGYTYPKQLGKCSECGETHDELVETFVGDWPVKSQLAPLVTNRTS